MVLLHNFLVHSCFLFNKWGFFPETNYYSHGGTGKYGFESDQKLLDSAILLIMIRGEQRGTWKINSKHVVFPHFVYMHGV